ncbi:MAG TPA: thioredoxin family protein [Rhodothermales bacterium]|nr:thioredoxin family protein [Rhodothermales bacterium]
MALTHSTLTSLGTEAPAFDLPIANPAVDDRSGDTRSLSDYDKAEALVVVFMCNHCPYVVHIEEALCEVARTYQQRGVAFVGISANDVAQYPQDGFDKMAERAEQRGYPFPYLYDASQDVARAYGAVCTPDIFVYDNDRRLAYRGRFDETRPGQGTATGADLSQALDDLLENGEVTTEQVPSMGCNIKWK